MNNYILLILIIFIVIYILYLYKNKTVITSEKYNNFDIEYNEDRDIQLSKENSTVFDYNHLIKRGDRIPYIYPIYNCEGGKRRFKEYI